MDVGLSLGSEVRVAGFIAYHFIICSLLGFVMNTLTGFTLCAITRVEYVAAVARLMKCPYGCCTIFPLWNCKFALMAFVRYVSIRPESLAAGEDLLFPCWVY